MTSWCDVTFIRCMDCNRLNNNIDRGNMNILCLTLVLVALSFVSEVSGLECKEIFKYQEAWAKPHGYCWTFVPGNRPFGGAKSACTGHFKGLIPIVDTQDKAAKLADFIKIVSGKYERGELGAQWEWFFVNGMKGWDAWLSPVYSSGNQMIWNETGTVVTFEAHQKGTPTFVSGNTCTVFSAETKTWRFELCWKRWTYVCEQKGLPVTTTTPPPPPQKVEEKKEEGGEEEEEDYDEDYEEDNGNCPAGFQSFEHKCFKLGKGNGTMINIATQFCEKHGGRMVKFNTKKDYDTVMLYLKTYFTSGSIGAYLDRVTWVHWRRLIWTADKSDASYAKAALRMRLPRRYMRPIYVIRPNIGHKGIVHQCPCCGPTICLRNAFCEATPKGGVSSDNYDDYY